MERGGPTTQAGIGYQNRIAALFLGELIGFDGEARDRIVEVRVEAPAHVDDIVVDYADGRRVWIQAKLALDDRSAAWKGLWTDFHAQRNASDFGSDDRLCLYLGDDGALGRTLNECVRRTQDSSAAEWLGRLTTAQRDQVQAIEVAIGGSALPIFERLDVVLADDHAVGRLAKRRLPRSAIEPTALLALLTNVAGDGSRRREVFTAPRLRKRLRDENQLRMEPPSDWGLSAYLETIGRERLSIPGTAIGGSPADVFVWPRTARTDVFRRDFDDEQAIEALTQSSELDLRIFPAPELWQAVIHAGPGFGKSALLMAVSQKIAAEGLQTPVVVSLAALSESGKEVVDYLNTDLNREFEVRIDWERLIETGAAVVLFDGLDEVAPTSRMALVQRLSRFTARRRRTPWLITVRDPVLIPANLDAQKIEVLPLADADMLNFVRRISPQTTQQELERLERQMDAYPEIRRLARIPLFLALIATVQSRGDDLPRQRGDLIEDYLKTLFRPEEHKPVLRPKDPDRLRRALQQLAYDQLATGKVGASERDVRRICDANAGDNVSGQNLFDDAKRCGVLLKQGPNRLAFPFPIVQEYLAAQELFAHHQDEIAARAAAGIDRPWAQSIQFALEQLADASPIARTLLDAPDDAFVSTARLLARCIVNGMVCDALIKTTVGDRLAGAWAKQSYWTANRIGQLLRDGWSQPLSRSLRAALHDRSVFHDGGEEILTEVADEELTRSVVESFWLANKSIHYGTFQPKVNLLSAFAFDLMLGDAKPPADEHEIWDAASAIRKLDGALIDQTLLSRVAADKTFPATVRMSALNLTTTPSLEEIDGMVAAAFAQDDYHQHWAALHLLAKTPDAERRLAELLRRSGIAPKALERLVDRLGDTLPDLDRRLAFLKREADATDLSDELRIWLRIWAMAEGDRPSLDRLISDFDALPEEALRPLLWSVNRFPIVEVGDRLVLALRKRVANAELRSTHIGSLMTGATHKMRMAGRGSAALEPAPAHPAYAAFLELLLEWRCDGGFNPVDAIHIEGLAAEAGVEGALERLSEITMREIRAGDKSETDKVWSNRLQTALRQLSQRAVHLPQSDIESLLAASDVNLRSTAVTQLGELGTRAALLRLLAAQNDRITFRSTLRGAIETAANRSNIRVVEVGNRLELGANAG